MMDESLDQLRQLLVKQETKAQRLKAQFDAAVAEHNDTATAIRVLEKHFGIAAPPPPAAPNENGATILEYVGFGEDGALAPKDIVDRLVANGHDLNADLVRTQLWRMAKRGMLDSENGKYWRPSNEDVFSKYAESVKDRTKPDPFADDDPEPPFEAPTPNRRPSAFDADLDDDVPF